MGAFGLCVEMFLKTLVGDADEQPVEKSSAVSNIRRGHTYIMNFSYICGITKKGALTRIISVYVCTRFREVRVCRPKEALRVTGRLGSGVVVKDPIIV